MFAAVADFVFEVRFAGGNGFEVSEGDLRDFLQGVVREERLVRGNDDVIEREEPGESVIFEDLVGMIFEEKVGFFFVDVERSAGDGAVSEGIDEGVGIDERAARGVDENGAGLDHLEGLCVDHVAVFCGERAVKGDDIGGGENGVEVGIGDVGVLRGEGIVGDDVHAKAAANIDEAAADEPCTNDAGGFSVQVESQQPVEGKVVIARADVGAVRLSIERHEECHGVFGDGVGGIFGDAHDVNFIEGVFHIDVVVARAAQRNRLDADTAQNIDGFGADIVVDKGANGVIASGKRGGIGGKFAFEEFKRKAVGLIFRVEIVSIVGFCIKNHDFHRACSLCQ